MRANKYLLLPVFTLVSLPSIAETINSSDLVKNYNEVNGISGYLMVTVLLLIVALLFMLSKVANVASAIKAKSLDEERTTWMHLFFRANAPKDHSEQSHVYDGIQEYDNNPPAWFNWLFYGTIVIAFCYLMYFHVLKIGDLQGAEYQKELEAAKPILEKAAEKGISLADKPAYTEKAKLSAGKDIFMANCLACHGNLGQGIVGPNLTDEYWIHGGKYSDIFKTIFNGVPEKGMLSWKKSLKAEEIREVASYVKSLQGTNPPNPKAPQGEKMTGL